MRVRTGHGPDDWKEYGACAPRRRHSADQAVQAVPLKDAIPSKINDVSKSVGNQLPNTWWTRMKARKKGP